jgi:hypothetical protein
MKKVFLALALVATLTVVSCKHVEAPASLTTVDSASVDTTAIDTVKVDTVKVDTTAVK